MFYSELWPRTHKKEAPRANTGRPGFLRRPGCLGGVAEQSQFGLALQALEGAGLRLAGVRHAHPELAGSLLDGVLALATGPVAQVDDLHLLGRQLLQELADAPGVV